MFTREQYFKAAEILEKNGWCQFSYKTHDGRLCVVTALALADPKAPELEFQSDWGVYSFDQNELGSWKLDNLEKFRVAVVQYPNQSLEGWNNEPGRIKEEVVAKLREFGSMIDELA